MKVTPVGCHDQKYERDQERQAAELRANPSAEHQEDTADHAGNEAELGEPDSSVSLDGECKECHAIIISFAPPDAIRLVRRRSQHCRRACESRRPDSNPLHERSHFARHGRYIPENFTQFG
jgi:hypothetical protein